VVSRWWVTKRCGGARLACPRDSLIPYVKLYPNLDTIRTSVEDWKKFYSALKEA
jgi:hypothetical protein